jgi:hypothetical protein
MAIDRLMMIHSAVHQPAVTDLQLWPMAVQHAVYIWNRMPSEKNGLSPINMASSQFSEIFMCGAVQSTRELSEPVACPLQPARLFV